MTTSETITACENVCRDFSWLLPLSWLADLATIFAAIAAICALSAWRRQATANRIADASIHLLASAREFATRIRSIRIGVGEIGVGESVDLTYSGRRKELHELSATKMQEAAELLRALGKGDGVQESMNSILRTKYALIRLLEEILDASRRGDQPAMLRKHAEFFSGSETNSYTKKLQTAIDALEKELHPLIRLEKGKKK